jgi:hypothetical protein
VRGFDRTELLQSQTRLLLHHRKTLSQEKEREEGRESGRFEFFDSDPCPDCVKDAERVTQGQEAMGAEIHET